MTSIHIDTIKNAFKEHISCCLLFCSYFYQKKSCVQNYLWNVWWKCYNY